jgi:succinate dehydrogenase/fumarate reductase-like Fe-S protein
MVISKPSSIKTTDSEAKNGIDHASSVYRIGEFVNCIQCEGVTKSCRYCGRKVNFVNGHCLNLNDGSLHRCGYGRY